MICEQSLFSNRLHQLEEICINEHKGDSGDFINNYLRPVVELLDTIRNKCEVGFLYLLILQRIFIFYSILPGFEILETKTMRKLTFYECLELRRFLYHSYQNIQYPKSFFGNIKMQLISQIAHDLHIFLVNLCNIKSRPDLHFNSCGRSFS